MIIETKRVIKSYIYTDNSAIVTLFGINEENEPMTIKDNNIESISDYMYEIIEAREYCESSRNIIYDMISLIRKELNQGASEVQVKLRS